ncbi:HD domain-containing protein [uncultured Desulfobacter sp.]|uniref:deoxyguanosinetriphosphate triphosphohydrolase family protein n=1 Tax=uncultured Desulfobacter sp. TaxID=240139 RepID=UPI002AAC0B62|nr:HD domain-containing protein [uncultured Desulfobacter sp.]
MNVDKTPRALKSHLEQREAQTLGTRACFSKNAVRRYSEKRSDTEYRLAFSTDADRILNALAYTRYSDKTQVFSLINNDHLTHRVLHVQMLSRVARTIGRYLGLNTDLIEAAAMGHDIGHTPFGHDGERFLSRLTQAAGAGHFHHNLQSMQFLDVIERNGKGWNLTLQTLDAIVCHNGEAHARALTPAPPRDFADLDTIARQIRAGACDDILPMTMEGCVVRIADTVSYIGRDFEDAVRLKIVTRNQIPGTCRDLLGTTQGTIVFALVTDLINTSIDQDFIGFSPQVADALKEFKQFNYRFIYKNPQIKRHLAGIEDIFKCLFDRYMNDLAKTNEESVIFSQFLNGMDDTYCSNHSHAEITRDFIAGMTDSFFIRQAPDHLRPVPIDWV